MKQAQRTEFIRKAHALAKEHEVKVKRAALKLDAERQWLKALNKEDRRNREFVLLALKSDEVPRQLSWHWTGFDRTCSMELKNDRDILLQRLELEDFEGVHKNRCYRVPQMFRNDKEVMLKIVSKNSAALSLASPELKADREVVMATIKNRQSCAPMAIRHASKKLRQDRRIARAVLRHGHGIKALKFLPRQLREDYNLVLLAVKSSSEECNETFETLSELSEEMVGDATIVLEAVKRRGSNLRFVKDLLLFEDEEIIMAACKNDGSAIQYCPKGPVRYELLRGSNLITTIDNGGYMALDDSDFPCAWKRKHYLAAVENGEICCADEMEKLRKKDEAFFMDILRHSNSPFDQYYELPVSIQNDFSVCLAILKTNKSDVCAEGSLAYHISKHVTDDELLRKHIGRLMSFAKHGYPLRGGDIWDDKTIVIALCKFDGDCYEFASSRLRTDVDVLRAIFSGEVSDETLLSVPRTLLQENIDIATMAIKACRLSAAAFYITWRRSGIIFDHFGEKTITSRTVLMEWVRKGWPLVYNKFPRSMKFHDDEMALEAVKQCKDGVWEFEALFRRFPSKKLLGDKAFMLAAVEAKPFILKFVSGTLLSDFDFLLDVVSMGRESLLHLSHQGEEFDALIHLGAQVRDKLAEADGFLVQFLGAIAIDPPQDKRNKRHRTCRGPEKRCFLRMLDVGGENGETMKRTIAEYAGASIGSELKKLRSALDTLQFWGY